MADDTAALDKMPKLANALYIRGLARLDSGDTAGGRADIAAARAVQPHIDQHFDSYGLAAKAAAPADPAVPDPAVPDPAVKPGAPAQNPPAEEPMVTMAK